MAVILVERGNDKGRGLKLGPGRVVTVGRERTCELPLRDVMVSRRHFQLRLGEAARVLVKDLRSSNGTFVNGRRLAPDEECGLEIEDKVQVGSTLFALVPDEAQGGKGELSGKTVGGYLVQERLGRGGMGTVYKAVQNSLDRPVALKILGRDLAQDRSRVDMFLTEARSAGKLNHPNIVQVYDVGESQGLYFFSMEFMERGSLDDVLAKEGRLLVPRALKIAIDAAKGLEFAERQRIVHRDVKPGNIMVNAEGVAKVGDLGIARANASSASTTGADAVKDGEELIAGSPLYMAPEQAKAGEVDHRADLYSFGATLHHLLSGEPPFSGSSPREVVLKHIHEPPRALAEIDPRIPADVSALVRRLLEKDPAARPAGAAALIEELRALSERYPEGWKPPAHVGEAAGGGGPALSPGATTTPVDGMTPLPGAPGFELPGGAPLNRVALIAAAVGLVALLVGSGGIYAVYRQFRTKAEERRVEAARLEEEARLETERLAAAATAEQARAKAAREAEAQKALGAADAYLRDNAQHLDEAKRRYLEVGEKFADTAVAQRARDQAAMIETLGAGLAEARRKRAAAEAAADAALAPILSALRTAPLGEIETERVKLQEAAKKHVGTETAERAVREGKRTIVERAEQASRAIAAEVEEAVRRGDFAAGHRALERAARYGITDLKDWLAGKHAALSAAERAAKDAAAVELERQRALELTQIAAAEDPARLQALRFPEIIRDLERLKAAGLRSKEARDEVEYRLFKLKAEEGLRQRFFLHVNKSERPEIKYPVTPDILGTAIEAKDTGLLFVGKDRGGGTIELKKAFSTLSADELRKMLTALPSLSALDRVGLACILLDAGDVDRAKRELESAARFSAELLPWIEQIRARAAAAPGGSGGSPPAERAQ